MKLIFFSPGDRFFFFQPPLETLYLRRILVSPELCLELSKFTVMDFDHITLSKNFIMLGYQELEHRYGILNILVVTHICKEG